MPAVHDWPAFENEVQRATQTNKKVGSDQKQARGQTTAASKTPSSSTPVRLQRARLLLHNGDPLGLHGTPGMSPTLPRQSIRSTSRSWPQWIAWQAADTPSQPTAVETVFRWPLCLLLFASWRIASLPRVFLFVCFLLGRFRAFWLLVCLCGCGFPSSSLGLFVSSSVLRHVFLKDFAWGL